MNKGNQEKHGESTTKKRLLSSSSPKNTTTIPTAPAHNMKTRDLPNLSECQACGFRIDTCTSGKSTIQILYSEWRIVLLCQKCLSRVQSSQICSYCFNHITHDFFTCCRCKRCVHRNCFFMYKSVAPWSYASAASQFSSCVDCWVPNSILRKRDFLRARRGSNNCPELCNSNSGGKDSARSLEANGDGDRKAVVAKKAVMKNLDQGVILDDAELAFQLHRVMNSSPRISKNFSATNSRCLSVQRVKELNDDSTVGGLGSTNSGGGVLELYNKLNENHLVCVENENVAVPFKEGEGSCSDKLVKSSGDENSLNLESMSCQNNLYHSSALKVETSNGKLDRYLLKYRKRNSVAYKVPNDKSKTLYGKFPCQSEASVARFLFKYRKRKSSSKGISDGKPEVLHERFFCQREALAARYLLKYRKRKTSAKAVPNDKSKALYERLLCQNEDIAAEFSLNCSGESRAFSNDSLQSCAFPLQASTSASCSSRGKT